MDSSFLRELLRRLLLLFQVYDRNQELGDQNFHNLYKDCLVDSYLSRFYFGSYIFVYLHGQLQHAFLYSMHNMLESALDYKAYIYFVARLLLMISC